MEQCKNELQKENRFESVSQSLIQHMEKRQKLTKVSEQNNTDIEQTLEHNVL